jgi:hypothetical protein
MAYIMLTGWVSAQLGARHVFTNFSETFPQFGNCRSFGGDARFSRERSDQL